MPQRKSTSQPTARARQRLSSAERQPTARLRRRLHAVETEVGVFLQEPLVVVEQSHRVVRLEAIGLNRLIYLRFEQAHQLEFIPLRHCEHFPDCAALDHFLNVPARFFIWVEENMYLRDPAKQIMQITHDVLVSAHHEEA